MGIRIRDICSAIETAAPLEWAAEWDHPGLQVGSGEAEVDAVVTALDVRSETFEKAREVGAGLVVVHHPPIFGPLHRIDPHTFPGREITTAIREGIALYAAHTNVDASPVLSMNLEIGKRLPLEDFAPVAQKPQADSLKLVTFIPVDSVPTVRSALAEAGAGIIGEYRECAFTSPGTGSFRGSDRSNPTLGERGMLEEVEEHRLEMVCPKRRLDVILKALWEVHPYEEVAYDLYPLSGYKSDSHYLWRGNLAEPTPLALFASQVKSSLGNEVAPVRYAGDPEREIRSVAWCSGGGKSLIAQAAGLGVDAFLTGDTGHHDALECLSRGMALIDLDHYHSECLFVEIMKDFLEEEFGGALRIEPDPSGPVYHAG